MGPAAAPAAPWLASVLDTGHHHGPHYAARALIRIGPAAVEPTLMALQLGDRHGRERACWILATLGDERAIGPLVSEAADGMRQRQAMEALRDFGKPARDYLLSRIENPDPAVRRRATLALPAFPDRRMYNAVNGLLSDRDAGVRENALISLKTILKHRHRAADLKSAEPHDSLLAIVREEDPRMRRLALALLNRMTLTDAAFKTIAEATRDDDRTVQLVAIESLSRTDERATSLLNQLIQDDDPLIRATAVGAMARVAPQAQLLQVLGPALRDEDAIVREKAVAGLRRLPVEQAADFIRQALNDSDAVVRVRAIEMLRERNDPDAAKLLMSALDDSDHKVRLVIVDVFETMGSAGHAGLRAALLDDEPAVRAAAAAKLRDVRDDKTTATLLRLLADSDGHVREEAMRSLAHRRKFDDVTPFRKVVDDPHWRVRQLAVRILAQHGDASIADTYIEVAKHPHHNIANAGVEGLSVIGQRGIEPLFEALEHPDGRVRKHAAEILTRKQNPEIRKRLAEAIRDGDKSLRETVKPVVERHPDARSPQVIVNLLLSGGAPDRFDPVDELAKSGKRAEAFADTLLKADNVRARSVGVRLLARLNGVHTLDRLKTMLDDPSPDVRETAARSIGDIGGDNAVALLGRAMQDTVPSVRETAIRVLGDLAIAAAVKPLAHALNHDDWQTRWRAAEALGRVQQPDALKPLTRALDDEHWTVRRAAVDAIAAHQNRTMVDTLSKHRDDPHWVVAAAVVQAINTLENQPDPKKRR